MKCIQCQTENNLKDRNANAGCCSSCNHFFVFEPNQMGKVKVTDTMFKRNIDKLSANNTLFFTQKQLTYFLDKRLRESESTTAGSIVVGWIFMNYLVTPLFGGFLHGWLIYGSQISNIYPFVTVNLMLQLTTILMLYIPSVSRKIDPKQRRVYGQTLRVIGFCILLLGIPASIVIVNSFLVFVAIVIMGMGSIYLANHSLSLNIYQELLFQPDQIKDWLKLWQEVNGKIFRLLDPPIKKTGTAKINSDVTAYSFDRLVVCQSAEIAQMLISNNFHFENNCAILSIEGYPEDIFDVTMQMLRRNTDLKVYIFHDCSIHGMRILHQLKNSDRWFKNSNVSIIDIGLTPNQVMTAKHLFIQTSVQLAVVAKEVSSSELTGLTLDEVAWLKAGNFVELESFTPQQLIQVLNRGIAGTRNLLNGSDSYTSISGSDGYLYTTESFG